MIQSDTSTAETLSSQDTSQAAARKPGIMDDVLEKLASDVKRSVVEHSARVADIHRIRNVENEYQRGYNAAVFDIAAKIRELNKPAR